MLFGETKIFWGLKMIVINVKMWKLERIVLSKKFSFRSKYFLEIGWGHSEFGRWAH